MNNILFHTLFRIYNKHINYQHVNTLMSLEDLIYKIRFTNVSDFKYMIYNHPAFFRNKN